MRAETISVRLLIAVGLLAFGLAVVSIVDMFRPQPYDGVVLESDVPGELIVAEVVSGSGADRARIRPGDRIVGIGRDLLLSTQHASQLLQRYRIGEIVPYLVESDGRRWETLVELGTRRIGSIAYLGACVLGFAFFLVGAFVLHQRPRLRVAQVFYLMSSAFLVFLVCRMRPASYSGMDDFVLDTGTFALLLVPGSFLHFFLIFPRPVWNDRKGLLGRLDQSRRLRVLVLAILYLLPAAVYLTTVYVYDVKNNPLFLISGAPRVNWWILGIYMALGLSVLAANASRLKRVNERRGALLVFFGALFGLLPFLVFTVAFPSFRHTEQFLYYGVVPLILVPLTFAYSIVRFQLLDIRVILRKSLFYTGVTAAITGIYAAGIAAFNWILQGAGLTQHPFFPIVFALAVVLGLEPLRRRLQGPVDRFFLGDLSRLHDAVLEMGEALGAHRDPGELVRELVQQLPERLGIHFAALYRQHGDAFERVAGPHHLPNFIPDARGIENYLTQEGPLALLVDRPRRALDMDHLLDELEDDGVALLGDLASPRRKVGLMLLSSKTNQLGWDPAELEILRGLLAQAAIALETSQLLDERTQQAELERELEIAARIQAGLLPSKVEFAPGWTVSAVCQPAKHVGGDFFAEIPAAHNGSMALVYGDVAGKSIPAALMMMAAQEVLHSLSMTHRTPKVLVELANRRLYRLQRRSFVALGYLSAKPDGTGIEYLLAGQPSLLCRRQDGSVEELPLAEHRLPLGALDEGEYCTLEVDLEDGDLVLGYSDGVLEAQSPLGAFFGHDRLVESLTLAPPDPERAVAFILDEIRRFTAGLEPYDDLTLVALQRQSQISPDKQVSQETAVPIDE
ncbi:MAG: SpoIIE family protein phosphatase [Thermoanaerobaculia bacterium]|nr:SpoIIE family protein phosphatase [Thermoanaerobaculia bacterium]